MPVFYIVIVILIVILIITVLLNLLFNPIVWMVIAALMIFVTVRRYLYQKQLEDYKKEFAKKTQEKKEYYYSNQSSQTRSNDDVIDVNYKVVDDNDE